MGFTLNLSGQVNQMRLPNQKALWPLFETIVNSIQSLEDTADCEHPLIEVFANRINYHQIRTDGKDEPTRFESFTVSDNGVGFTERNYHSFLEAYSSLKVEKGCKGIGRFLWLKAFDKVHIKSIYTEDGTWRQREFDFDLKKAIDPENNSVLIDSTEGIARKTEITLSGFYPKYRDVVPYPLGNLANKIIEHCLPYFIMGRCPEIVLKDSLGEHFNLNTIYEQQYKETLHQDHVLIKDLPFTLYHMAVSVGAEGHELHLCANNREVKSYNLSAYLPNLQKKITSSNGDYFYEGYLTGSYLDRIVDADRFEFDFSSGPLINKIAEDEVLDGALNYIRLYLGEDLDKIRNAKREQIDRFVKKKKPQYRYLLNQREDVYDRIPVGLTEEKLDLELYRQEQQWELEIAEQKVKIEERQKNEETATPEFIELFKEYCSSITQLSQASLAEYVVRRKAVIQLLEKALEIGDDGKYSLESRIHSIICPMRITSDNVQFDEMNLWLIDDRLAYHHFLASDQYMSALPVLESEVHKRMDLAIFDKAISYSADDDTLNSITIIEFKRPMRDDLSSDDRNPINQVLRYVDDIKKGKAQKANGRGFGNVTNAAFYCYVIADLTETLREDAANAGLNPTPDGGGFFGFNAPRGAYIEVISYDKLVKDANKRNSVLFDKLFRPKSNEIMALNAE